VYPDHFGPAITASALTWLATWMVIISEAAVGLFGIKGAFDMARASGRPADAFNASKKIAILACGLAMFVWMGFFMAIGSAYFQMWQTQVGDGSLKGAFMFAASSGIVLLFVNQPDG
jgi:predicted small integral membrane protein